MENVNSINSIQKLVDAIKKYQNQTIVISSLNGMQVLDNVDIIITDDIIYLDTDKGFMKFEIDKIGIDDNNNIENVYIDEIEKEIHIIFTYDEIEYSILNLV